MSASFQAPAAGFDRLRRPPPGLRQLGPGPLAGGLGTAEGLDALAAAFDDTGLVLVRGVPLGIDAFEAATQRLCPSFHHVATRRALRQGEGDGYTTEVFRDNFILLGHTEGHYRPWPPPPQACFFLCVRPPAAAGGETTVVDGAAFHEALPAALRDRLERQGVIYESLWERERWQAEFGVADREALQALLAAQAGVRFELSDEDTLHLHYASPALSNCRTGERVFANGVLAHLPRIAHPRYAGLPAYAKASNRVSFGDGEPLSDAVIGQLIDIHDDLAYPHGWQHGDLLVLDNTRYLHGRLMTAAPCERILLSRFGRLGVQAPRTPTAAVC